MKIIDTPEELLNQFPQLNFNLENQLIYHQLIQFITYRNSKTTVLHIGNIRRLVREFFKDTFEITFPNVSNMSPKFYEARGFSPDEAKEKASSFYKDKIKGKRVLPTQLVYYSNKGQSPEEAKVSLKKEQAKRADKLVQKELDNPELRKRRLWVNIEYWINKGYSEEVGYELMAEKFKERDLQTMKKLTQKYIDKGFSEVDAIESAQKDYKKRAKKIMKTRIENKSFGWQKASKQSLKFFQPLIDYLDKENIEYYVGDETHQEWFIAKGVEYFYSYDFYIPSKKLIIEYNGEHIHPNPEMSKEAWNNWRHCWTKKTADECQEIDSVKIKLAESKGYSIIEVFESSKVKSLDLIASITLLT